jgi:hypothetical protein
LPSGFALTAITTAMAAYYAISPLEDDAVIRQQEEIPFSRS